MRQLPMNLMK